MALTEIGRPRLLYLADVPVEATYHGSTQLYRLLANYPADSLIVIEQNFARSVPERRLRGVRYAALRTPGRRLSVTRFHRLVAVARARAAPFQARQLPTLLATFAPQAVLTVAHGFAWLTAAKFAKRHGLPLHLIVHDDWARLAPIPAPLKSWFERRFADVYRQAASRLCVSPAMATDYERRYGVAGTVLLPVRAADTPEFDRLPDDRPPGRPFTVAFAGTNNTPGALRQLAALGRILARRGGRLLVFGPTSQSELADGANVEVRGFVPDLISALRLEADAVFLPMSFASGDRPALAVSFPSKLTDYTAAALPLLIWGPRESAGMRWALAEPNLAAVVTDPSDDAMALVLDKLFADVSWREQLARTAAAAGRRDFLPSRAAQIFDRALSCQAA